MGGTAVIIDGIRTPWAPAGDVLGGLTTTDLAVAAIRELLEWTEIRPARIDQVIFGTFAAGSGLPRHIQSIVRRANLGNSIPFYQIDQHRGAGIQALLNAFYQIESGQAGAVIVSAAASMTAYLAQAPAADRNNPLSPHRADGVARKFDISRDRLDEFAASSHSRARYALENELLSDEMCHLHIPPAYTLTVDRDQLPSTIAADTDALSKLAPLYDEVYGSATTGNTARAADGAAALLIMSAEAARDAGLKPVCAIRAVGLCAPAAQSAGLSGAAAAGRALSRMGSTSRSLDLFEIDEESAASALVTIQAFESPDLIPVDVPHKASLSRLSNDSINVNGGAIGWGDVPGCSGLRQVVTLLKTLQRKNLQSGMAIANMDDGAAAAIALEML